MAVQAILNPEYIGHLYGDALGLFIVAGVLAWLMSRNSPPHAKREETKQKHLAQMLDELEGHNLYMNMAWRKTNTLQRRLSNVKTPN